MVQVAPESHSVCTAIFEKRQEGAEADTLMDDFAVRHKLTIDRSWRGRQIEAFLTFDPHWGDPRFLAEFLRCLRHPNGTNNDELLPGFSDTLTQLLELRDIVAHQIHTMKSQPPQLRSDTVKHSIQDMLNLVEGLQELVGTEFNASEELVALRQLNSAFGSYKCWRDRQERAIPKENALARSFATVEGLVKALEQHHQAQLEQAGCNAPIGSLGSDGLNTAALSDLLHIYVRMAAPAAARQTAAVREEIAREKIAANQRTSISTATTNPFDLLMCDEDQ